MTHARATKNELRRLVLAHSDIESADALLMLIVLKPELPAKINQNALALGQWTGALVSYARPFTRATQGISADWGKFEHQARLVDSHRAFLKMRNQLFAHNDDVPLRGVELVPPTGARETRGRMTRATVHALKRLCHHQLERLNERITELATVLACEQGWPAGVPIDLHSIDDHLELLQPRSPFQVPPGIAVDLLGD